MLVHNHPSGDVSPSEADARLTRRIAEAARILQIHLLDHVIVGQPMANRQGYGGQLWATANTSHGTVFQFTLPIHDERMS